MTINKVYVCNPCLGGERRPQESNGRSSASRTRESHTAPEGRDGATDGASGGGTRAEQKSSGAGCGARALSVQGMFIRLLMHDLFV